MVDFKKLPALYFVFVLSGGFAQGHLDSLESQLSGSFSESKVDLLNDLALGYASVSGKKAAAFACEAINTSRNLNYEKGIIASLRTMARIKQGDGELDSSKWYLQESIALAEKVGDKGALADNYNALADIYDRQDDYPPAIRYYKEALEMYSGTNNAVGMSNSMRNIGATLRRIGDYGNAMEYLLQALKLDRENNFEEKVAKDLLIIAFTYINQAEGNLSLDSIAVRYLKVAEQMPVMQKDLKLQIDLYNYLGQIAKKNTDYEMAIRYYELAIEACNKLGDSPAVLMQNLAVAYMSKGDYTKALELADVVLEMKRKIGRKSSIGFTLDLYAKTYLKMGEHAKAIPYAEESMEIARSTGSPSRILQPYEFLSEAYAGLRQYDKAWELRLKYETIKDSLFNAQRAQQQATMLSLFESEKQQQTIELQESNLALTKATNNQLIFGLVAVLVVASAIFIGYLGKAKTNRLLAKQKNDIELRDREKEVLLKEIHHRVKNNLQIISSILNMQSRKLMDESAKNAVDEGRSRIKSMSLIHEKLYSSNQLTVVNMKEYIEDLSGFLFKTYKPGCDIARQIEAEELTLDIDTAIPVGLILNELITNALKYAFHEQGTGQLNISFSKLEDEYTLRVADSGKGLPIDFEAIESMGMRLVNVLTEQLNGLIDVKNDAGAIFTIRFKKGVVY